MGSEYWDNPLREFELGDVTKRFGTELSSKARALSLSAENFEFPEGEDYIVLHCESFELRGFALRLRFHDVSDPVNGDSPSQKRAEFQSLLGRFRGATSADFRKELVSLLSARSEF